LIVANTHPLIVGDRCQGWPDTQAIREGLAQLVSPSLDPGDV
jgi:hypothetical protein